MSAPPHDASTVQVQGGPPREARVVPPEQVIATFRPAGRSIVAMGFGRLVALLLLAVLGVWLVTSGLAPLTGQWVVIAAIVLALLMLAWLAIVRDRMAYRLTDRRATAKWGVFNVVSVEAELGHATNVTVLRPIVERLLGLGTVVVLTPSESGAVLWSFVSDPWRVAEQASRAIARAQERPPGASTQSSVIPTPAPTTSPMTRHAAIPVLGLAGGIGAGKSTVGRAFERLGCVVIDSDQRARAALDRADVRDELVRWWGSDLLFAGGEHAGKIDRAKVAAIVFKDPARRQRLESLVHPIVRQERAAMIAEMSTHAPAATGVIVDAPLLFEAGVDKECDAVVFVDAPLHERAARVQRTRGWAPDELSRREAAQMPLEDKRSRCRYVVSNTDGTPEGEVLAQAKQILDDATLRTQARAR